MKAIRILLPLLSLAWLMLAPSSAVAAELRDGTIVQVRLVSPISSELAKPGDSIRFVVASDVVVNGAVVIARKTPALGAVVTARRTGHNSSRRHPILAVSFIQTTGVDGQAIRLRAPNDYGQVTIDRSDYHHELQWATEGDVFHASVAGDYVFRLK
jgi:hypothetical protein